MATESFFSNASLAYLASAGAGKDGKTYSIKPTDGSGDFTFSRGSNLAATRVGPTGLIEKGRENLLLQSNNFDTTWSKSSVSVTSGQSGYDGSSDAWLLEATATTSARIEVANSNTGVLRASVYVKEGTTNWVHLNTGSQRRVWFDLSGSGAVGTITNSANTFDAKIEAVSGATGWFRISYIVIDPTNFRIYPADSDGGNATLGDNILIQDAQLEIGLAATDYIESGATTGKAGLLENEPRFDYSGGATCPSLLLEPSRTNLVQSEYFGGYSNNNSTDEANATTSPEGLVNATAFLEAATTSQHKLVTSYGFDGSSTYTFSVFAKYNGRDLYIDTGNSTEWGGRAWFDLTAGTANAVLGTADIEDFGNGWYRCIVTGASTLAGGNSLELLTSNGSANATIGDITKGVYIYGAQLEIGSYPTSYIPNHSGGSVTRGAEAIEQATSSFDITGDYTFFFEVSRIEGYNSGNSAFITLNNTTDSSIIFVYNRDNDKNIRFLIREGATGSASIYSPVNSFEIGERVKFCIRKDSTKTEVFFNGSSIGSTTNHKPDGFNSFLSGFKLMTMYQNLVFPEALSDADCIALTS
jgi:hypothetical protein